LQRVYIDFSLNYNTWFTVLLDKFITNSARDAQRAIELCIEEVCYRSFVSLLDIRYSSLAGDLRTNIEVTRLRRILFSGFPGDLLEKLKLIS
jgi:hypothetical protein